MPKQKSNKLEIESKIEYQEIIGEIDGGGFQPIRFTRVKYKAANFPHIDIRKYQRAPGDWNDETDEVEDDKFYPTKFGFRFPESDFVRLMKNYTILPQTFIHPEIIKKSFKLLDDGHYESAVLQSFKIIETKIRKMINADPDEVGIKLIRKAFNPENGKLTDYDLPISEREAFANYISGAFGYYKNPYSHRDIELNYLSAFDRMVVASDLLKIIDKKYNCR